MASRIPTPALRGQEVGSVQSQFTPTPFQNLNPDADVFGAGQARALQQVSAGLSAAADGLIKQAQDDDNSALLATQNGSMAFTQDMVNNPVDGLLTRQKNNAVGATKEALDKFASWKASVPQASTESGRAAQAAYFGQQEAQLYQTVSGHERTQRVEVRKEEYGTLIANSMQAMATNYLNPQALASNEELIRATAIRLSDTVGSSKEAAAEAAEKAVSDAYSGVLYRMIGNKDSEQARALHTELLRAGKLQPSKENTALATALDKVEAEEAGMKLGLEAQVKHPNNPDLAAKYILGLNVPQEVKAAALTFADQQNARVQRADAQELKRIAQEQGIRASRGELLDEAALARLPGAQQAAIRAIYARVDSGAPTSSNSAAYREFYIMTPEERGRLDENDFITKYWANFSETDRKLASASYGSARSAAGRADAVFAEARGKALTAGQTKLNTYFEKQVKEAITQRYPTSNMSPTNKRRAAALASQLRSNFTDGLYRADSLFATPEDVDEFLRDQFVKVNDAYVAFAGNPPKFGTGDKVIDITDFDKSSVPEVASLNNSDFSFLAKAYIGTLSPSDTQITENTIDTKKFEEYIRGQVAPAQKNAGLLASVYSALVAAGRNPTAINVDREYRRRALQILINRGDR